MEIEVAAMREIEAPCLLVRRFDRTLTGEKIHFEEFNQLRGQPADAKYEGSYGEIAEFIVANQQAHREEDVRIGSSVAF